MHACRCTTRETYFARMTFADGQVHYREVCRTCRGNARGAIINVGTRELRDKGIDPASLPDLPGEEAIGSPGLTQRGLFDDEP